MAHNERTLLSRKQAAEYLTQLGLSCAPHTLANYAINDNQRGGPPFVRLGWKGVRYHPEDLRKWFDRMVVRVE